MKKSASTEKTTTRSDAFFSVPAFLHGVGGGLVVLGLMAGWMTLRKEDTLHRIQDQLPSKTAVIERVTVKPAPVAATNTPLPTASELLNQEDTSFPGEGADAPSGQYPDGVQASSKSLPAAPIEGLYETKPEGQLPIANLQTGVTPFDAYKRPAALVPGRAPVSILLVGTGLSQKLTDQIIADLPEDISLSVSPYALKPGVWMDKARMGGHEVWLTLPLQNDTYPNPDPGPQTILSNVSLEKNQARLLQILATGAGYAGLISLGDHNITANNPSVEPLLQQIFGRGLAFVDGRTDRPFFGEALAQQASYPYAQASLWLGEDLTPQAAAAQLAEIERHAHSNGQAIVFAYPTAATVAALAEWSKTLDTRGLQLVPLSAQVRQ